MISKISFQWFRPHIYKSTRDTKSFYSLYFVPFQLEYEDDIMFGQYRFTIFLLGFGARMYYQYIEKTETINELEEMSKDLKEHPENAVSAESFLESCKKEDKDRKTEWSCNFENDWEQLSGRWNWETYRLVNISFQKMDDMWDINIVLFGLGIFIQRI
jgi:hypothetical protein